MKPGIISVCIFLIWMIPLYGQNTFRAGAATNKITPPAGTIMGNSYGLTICEGVHDDIYARTLVFEQGGKKAAFIAVDVVSLPYTLVMETRKLISQKTGIPETSVIMTATHVHAGPQMNPLFWDCAPSPAKLKSEEYFKKLPALISESVVMADKKLQPVKVSVGKAEETRINFNRRFLMKDGTFKMNPGSLNPDAVRAVGPVDPDVYVVYFETIDSKPVALLVNFALHPAIIDGNNQISADFPGVVCRLLSEVKGEEMVTVYTNGTSGNINHVDVTRTGQLKGHAESNRIGTIIAGDVMKALSSSHPVNVNSLQALSTPVELPAPFVSQEEVARSKAVIARHGTNDPPAFNDVVEAWRVLDLAGHKATTTVPVTKNGGALKTEVQAIILGNELALVGFPGDAFTELGMAIKMNSPYPYTIVSEQSGNGTLSYIPNRKAIYEGGYEGESARFLPGGGEMLVDSVIKTLIELYW